MISKNQASILLITFNRPNCTKRVMEVIRDSKVKKLYIYNDGPRRDIKEDIKARNEIKKLIEEIDWECELHTNFQNENLGCGWGPATGISWAFENEDRLIILEDDCVPSHSFFKYCNHCLEKYKDDTRIWLISGRSHHQDTKFFKEYDYLFTHYGHSWGWATWKRVWNHFDMDMKDFPEFLKLGGAHNVLNFTDQANFYNRKYSKFFADKQLSTHVWDFQFGFSIVKNGGLCIVPSKNLIENIGYIGTHSSKKSKSHFLLADEDYTINNEPHLVLTNNNYERYHFDNHIKKIWGKAPLYKRIINRVLKITKLR